MVPEPDGDQRLAQTLDPQHAREAWLLLASDPDTSLETLLKSIFHQVQKVTDSDVGGALLLREGESSDPAVVVQGVARERAVPPLQAWLERAPTPVPASCLLLANREQAPPEIPVTTEGRSALLTPLVDKRRTLGVLVVESSQTGFFRDRHREEVENLAKDATLAIRRYLAREHLKRSGLDLDMVGVSAAFLELERQAKQAAAHPKAPVLILGERGTGKELTARAIHAWSDRREGPFVPVLASALADTLVADELYGHEAHAFTGAGRHRQGKFQLADQGTLFLDEVADMPLPVQSSLLRAVERGEMQRVGRDRTIQVDVRILAATNRDLDELMEQREFRSDFYDRLSVFQLRVPPLRKRGEDIPLLAMFFLRKYCKQLHRYLECEEPRCGACAWTSSLRCMSEEFSAALQTYSWPGNVRELANLMLRLLATVEDPVLEVEHLPRRIRDSLSGEVQASKLSTANPSDPILTLESAVRHHIERVLRMADYQQSQAARILGLPYSTLQSKIKKLGIEVQKP